MDHHVVGCGRVALPARHDDELAGQPADPEVALPGVAPFGLGHRVGDPDARRIDGEPAGLPPPCGVLDLGQRGRCRVRRHPEHHVAAALLGAGGGGEDF